MTRTRLVLTAAVAIVTTSAIAAPGAQADVYSCSFSGTMGPITPYNDPGEARADAGMEAIANDLMNDEGDGGVFGARVLTDTDSGNGSDPNTGQDGEYAFSTDPDSDSAICAYVETGSDSGRVSGVYDGVFDSIGEYNSIVCGTGWVADDDVKRDGVSPEVTSLEFGSAGVADILDLDFRIDFVAGQGFFDGGNAENADGEIGSGHAVDGVASVQPVHGNCVTTDVIVLAVSGNLTIAMSRSGSRILPPISIP